MNKPKIIYKYEQFSTRSLQNLKAQSLYFGSPLNFNDPYDCALYPNIKAPTNEELEELRRHLLQKPNRSMKTKEQIKKSNFEELRKETLRIFESLLKENIDTFLKTRGVTCFSERNDDLLMWSHYGGCYKGFCLGFSTDYKPFTKMRKVKYCSVMPRINMVSALLSDDFDQTLDMFCTKSESWKYEKEWRIIHSNVGTLFTYEASALKSLYFGPDIDRESLEIICLILKGQNPEVKLWKGKRSREKFEVIFEPFTYTSYIEAKRQGLLK